MWIFKLFIWIALCFTITKASLQLKYSTTELLCLWSHFRTPPALLAHRNIPKRPRYVHHGSGRNFVLLSRCLYSNIGTFWSTEPHPPQIITRTVNHSELSTLPKAATYAPLSDCAKRMDSHCTPKSTLNIYTTTRAASPLLKLPTMPT